MLEDEVLKISVTGTRSGELAMGRIVAYNEDGLPARAGVWREDTQWDTGSRATGPRYAIVDARAANDVLVGVTMFDVEV